MTSPNHSRAGTTLIAATILIVLMTGTMFSLSSYCIANHQTEKQSFQDKELQLAAESVMDNAYALVLAAPTLATGNATLTTPYQLSLNPMSNYTNYGGANNVSISMVNNVYAYAWVIEQSTTNYTIEAFASRLPLNFSGVEVKTGQANSSLMVYNLAPGAYLNGVNGPTKYDGQYLRRAVMNLTVTAGTTASYAFGAGFFAGGSLALTSSGLKTDGYNSNTAPYATSHDTTGGSVGSNQNISLTASNTTIGGNMSSPGNISITGSLTVDGNVDYGSGKTYTGTGDTVKGSATPTGTAVVLPPLAITVPGTNSNSSLSATWYNSGTTAISYTGNTTMNFAAGTYVLSGMSLTGSDTINIGPGNVVMYFTGNVTTTGSSTMNLASGTTLTIYQTAGTFSATGITTITDGNATPKPADFQMYDSSTGAVTVTGSASAYGVIYAPNAPISITGGSTWYGSMVTGNNFTVTASNFNFHYDEALASLALPNTTSSSPAITFNGWNMW